MDEILENQNTSESSKPSEGIKTKIQKLFKTKPENTKSNSQDNKSKPRVIKTGFDPKNRKVSLIKAGESFTVKKPATNFLFKGKEKEAKEIYEFQISCSHN